MLISAIMVIVLRTTVSFITITMEIIPSIMTAKTTTTIITINVLAIT